MAYISLNERLNNLILEGSKRFEAAREGENPLITPEISKKYDEWGRKTQAKRKYDSVLVHYLEQNIPFETILRTLELVNRYNIDIRDGSNDYNPLPEYDNFYNLETAVAKYKKNKIMDSKSKQKYEKIFGSKNYILVHKPDDKVPYFVYRAIHPQGIVELGNDTEWCVGRPGNSMYSRYGSDNVFYIFFSPDILDLYEQDYGKVKKRAYDNRDNNKYIGTPELIKKYSYKYAVLIDSRNNIHEAYEFYDRTVCVNNRPGKFDLADFMVSMKNHLSDVMVYDQSICDLFDKPNLLSNGVSEEINIPNILGVDNFKITKRNNKDETIDYNMSLVKSFTVDTMKLDEINKIYKDLDDNYKIDNIFSNISFGRGVGSDIYTEVLTYLFDKVDMITGNIRISSGDEHILSIVFKNSPQFDNSLFIAQGFIKKVSLGSVVNEIRGDVFINGRGITEIVDLPSIIGRELNLTTTSITKLPILPDYLQTLNLSLTKLNNTDNISKKSIGDLYIQGLKNFNITELPEKITGKVYAKGTKLSDEDIDKLLNLLKDKSRLVM